MRSSRPGIEFECAECGSPHGIDQSVDSVVRSWLDATETAEGGATVAAATDGGVRPLAMRAVRAAARWPGSGSITDRSPLPYLPLPDVLEGPEPWGDTALFTEVDVRLGRVPPPELVAREVAEATQTGRRVTRKEWSSEWYARRFDVGGDAAAEGDDTTDVQLADEKIEAVRELVRVEGVEWVPSLLGRLGIDSSRWALVSEVVEDAG